MFAYEANREGKKCLVIDKRNHIAGNVYTENVEEIQVHKYGAHIYFIQVIKRYGTMLINLLNLIDILIVQ